MGVVYKACCRRHVLPVGSSRPPLGDLASSGSPSATKLLSFKRHVVVLLGFRGLDVVGDVLVDVHLEQPFPCVA